MAKPSGMVLTNYTVQCTDQISGKVGCFLFDLYKWKATGKFYAVSEVYPDLYEFYKGTTPDQRKPLCEERYQ